MVKLFRDPRGVPFQAAAIGSTTLNVAFTDSSVQSVVFDEEAIVRIITTQNCHVAYGTDPTATPNNMFMTSGSPEYFVVHPGHRLAFIRNSDNGTAFITIME